MIENLHPTTRRILNLIRSRPSGKAFPQQMAGVYTREEMDQADFEPVEPVRVERHAPSEPMFHALPKERQDKARAKFWALAGELDMDEASIYEACHQLAYDESKGRRSLNASTVRQVSDAINMLSARSEAALASPNGISVSEKTREALAGNPAWPQIEEEKS